MKILVISDSHGSTNNILTLKKQIKKVDLVIHCGDGTEDFDFIKDYMKCDLWGVSGNMDSLNIYNAPRVIDREIEGKKIHIEHGDAFNDWNSGRRLNNETLLQAAKASGYDVIFYGHTHVQSIVNEDGIWLINPGSISLPKDSCYPSYIIMETDGKGGFSFNGERL